MAKYPDLKSFVNVNYIDVLSSEIQKFVDKNLDGNGFHSINVVSLMQHRVENVAVKTIRCQEAGLQKIKMKIGVAADIVDLTLGTKKTEASRKTRWFYVTVEANIDEKLKDPIPLYTEEFYSGHFEKESALDQFLLPYVYTAELENMADDFTLFYCTDAIYDGYKFPAEYVLRELGIDCHSADLPDNCFGRMYFKEGKASIYSSYPMIGEVNDSDAKIKPGTILLNRNRFYLGNDGTFRLTIAHELIHWYLHKKYFKLLSILDDDAEVLSCEVEPNQLDDSMAPAQKAHWFAEWQANALAIRIAMPQELTVRAFYEARETASPYVYTGEFVEDIISRVAVLFDVPRFVVKQRARQLDWDLVDGAFVHVDGRYHDAFSFQEGILDQHQTFILDQKGYEKLYHNSREFADLIDSGKYIYLGYVVCKNDPNDSKNLVDVYMPINRNDAKKMGYKSSDICVRRIGIKNVTCIKTQGTPEFKKWWETTLDTEARAELREKRCLVSDGKGGFMRCPECNSCEKCEKRLDYEFSTNKPLSLEQLTQAESDDDKTIDIAGPSESEADILTRVMLEDLIEYLGTFEGKRYDTIFQMLYDQCGTQEIADELGVAWSTAKDAVKKVRQLAQEHTGITRN